MSLLFGQPFDEYVKKQIEVRQQALGQNKNIQSDIIQWNNNKTPWLRLISSVNLKKATINLFGSKDNYAIKKLEKIIPNPKELQGSRLAKHLILQGGTMDVKSLRK